MPFVQRYIEPKYLSRTTLFDDDGNAKVNDEELQAVTNNTLTNALRQLASLVLVANDIFNELGTQLQDIQQRAETIKIKINVVEEKVLEFDPKKVTVRKYQIFFLLQTFKNLTIDPGVYLGTVKEYNNLCEDFEKNKVTEIEFCILFKCYTYNIFFLLFRSLPPPKNYIIFVNDI